MLAWKAYWSRKNLKVTFLETIFNERQSGKDQCDRDSATAKRQMQYFIERGNNIDSADQMYEALNQATALCGFTANVLDIQEKKTYEKLKQIKDISKIHHVKYHYDGQKTQYQVWQYSNIGPGKKFTISGQPDAPLYEEIKPFFDVANTFGTIRSANTVNSPDISCTMDACILRFPTLEKLERHLSYGRHKYEETKQTQLSKVTDNWVQRFQEGSIQQQMTLANQDFFSTKSTVCLRKGWAIPKRVTRRLTKAQKTILNKIYDHGEVSGNKASADKAEKELRRVLKPPEWLLVSTIKSYFSRRTALKKKGKITTAEEDMVDDGEDDSESDDEAEESEEDEINEMEEVMRAKATASISAAISGLCIQKDEWIAVGYPRGWYPGQFVQFDSEEEEIQVHFLKRSASNPNWFVWPELSGSCPDLTWISEGK